MLSKKLLLQIANATLVIALLAGNVPCGAMNVGDDVEVQPVLKKYYRKKDHGKKHRVGKKDVDGKKHKNKGAKKHSFGKKKDGKSCVKKGDKDRSCKKTGGKKHGKLNKRTPVIISASEE